MNKNILLVLTLFMSLITCSAGEKIPGEDNKGPQMSSKSIVNLKRAIVLAETAMENHFTGSGMTMARYYNPYLNKKEDEVGSVWMYTSAVEATNAILHALLENKTNEDGMLYSKYFKKFENILSELYNNADYYLGTFTLTSYTQTKEWSVYGVNRGASKGSAKVEGIENVYDDQMWLIRELVESYKLTENESYLHKAEYLTDYVLDGWDTTIDKNGVERGGIPWGPGYVTKHSCSNGPLVSPLVWLHEIYAKSDDVKTYNYIDSADKKSRKSKNMQKSEYYLMYAKKVYDWQKRYLLRNDGVYDDFMGGCSPGKPETETIDGTQYRKGISCNDVVGPAYSYNSGTMLSGAADLYRVTKDDGYLADGKKLSDASFSYFASQNVNVPGYYTFSITGFNNWFNGVLMRGYVDIFTHYPGAAKYIDAFQKNLDYGYDNFLHKGVLPTNLLIGWSKDNNNNKTEGMFSFTFSAEYAVLSSYALTK